MPFFLPRRNRNWDPNPLDIIFVSSSSDSPPPPLRRSARKSKHRRHSSWHMSLDRPFRLARASQATPVKQRPRTRNRRSSGKRKAGIRDNSGSNKLTRVLQNAFESKWYGPGSTNTSPKERMRKNRRTKKPAKEVVVVDDEEDEGREQEKQKQTANLPTSLDQALAKAFSLNPASLNVAAKASTSAQAQGPPCG